jgi:hypothetical protein
MNRCPDGPGDGGDFQRFTLRGGESDRGKRQANCTKDNRGVDGAGHAAMGTAIFPAIHSGDWFL